MFSRYYFGEDLPTLVLLAEIVFAGVVVVTVATRLTRLADRFADEWRLGKAFVGMLLLATVRRSISMEYSRYPLSSRWK